MAADRDVAGLFAQAPTADSLKKCKDTLLVATARIEIKHKFTSTLAQISHKLYRNRHSLT